MNLSRVKELKFRKPATVADLIKDLQEECAILGSDPAEVSFFFAEKNGRSIAKLGDVLKFQIEHANGEEYIYILCDFRPEEVVLKRQERFNEKRRQKKAEKRKNES